MMVGEEVERVEGYHDEFSVREEKGVEEAAIDLEGCDQEEREVGECHRYLSQDLHS